MDERLTRWTAPRLLEWMAGVATATPRVDASLGSITLAAHQIDAAARIIVLLTLHRGALLADEVGLGKTYTALAVARTFGGFQIVGPASLRGMWADAIARTGLDARFHSFDDVRRHHPSIPPADLVIVDEAHHVRNSDTQRFVALARLTFGARILLLSATPVHNSERDVRSLFSLNLGARAWTAPMSELGQLIVRREQTQIDELTLPDLGDPEWLPLPKSVRVFRALQRIPPPVPAADGAAAGALVRLGLLRAWSSSDAAVRASLVRRLQRSAALTQALQAGRFPDRRELTAWTVDDGAMQLAFPEFVVAPKPDADARALLAAIEQHVDGVRDVIDALDLGTSADVARAAILRGLRERHQSERMVVFTQFERTARAMFVALRRDGNVGLVTSQSARIASGRISRDELIAAFGGDGHDRVHRRERVDILVATDVLSEGLNLQSASVLVHLDVPWTLARLTQRIGRVRRIGSRHRRVSVYAIGPPVGARELSSGIRALQRKARVIRSLVGTSELVSHAPLFGDRLRMAIGNDADRDVATRRELLHRALARWRNRPADAPAEPLARADSIPCAIAELVNTPCRAMALVRTTGVVRVVVVLPNEISEDHALATCVLDRLAHATPRRRDSETQADLAARPEATSCTAPASRDERLCDSVVARLEHWLEGLRAAALAAPALATPSSSHTRVLSYVAELLAAAPRHERPSLVALAERCRARVIAARGAGAELVLADWLSSARSASCSAIARLESLASALALRYGAERGDAGVDRVLAILVITDS